MKRFSLVTGLLSGFLFGIATPFSKLLLEGLNSFQLAGLLYLGAGLAMIPFILKGGSQVKMLFKAESRFKTLGLIFFGGFLGPLLLMLGLKTAHAASVSIWLNMELVATAILGVILFKDTLDRYTLAGLVLTVLAGVITSFGEGSSGLTSALFITAACFCWAMDNHLTAIIDGASPQAVTFVKGLVAGSINLLIGCWIAPESIALIHLAPALLLGAFSYGFSIVLYVTAAQNMGATRSQILFSTAPLWGVLLSYLFFEDSFQWMHLGSMLLLAVAVALTSISSHSHVHSHKATTHLHLHQHNDDHHNHPHHGQEPFKGRWHSHLHTHDPITHQHPHSPDLHHRHTHEK